jgi:hypothetical protein
VAPDEASVGSTVAVTITHPERTGSVVLSLDRNLDQLATLYGPAGTSNPDQIKEHHEQANRSALWEESGETTGTKKEFSVAIPKDLVPGTYILRAYLLATDGGDAIGSAAIVVRAQ